ncbi:MAG: DNA mismatch repair protein MutS, partial [Candidatus Dadabacteria bacterium]
HLELVENCRDLSSTGTLFSEINFTSTAGGSRLLRRAILKPLAIKEEIAKRLNLVELLVENKDLRELLQERLRELPDLERIATRIELKAVTPAELGSVRDGLKAALKIKERLTDMPCKNPPQMLIDISEGLSIPQECLNLLSSSLVDTPPYSLSDGSIFREGYNAELDRLRKIGREGKGWFASYETAERNRTGIASLKVKYNSVFGYFIEVSKANLAKVPQDYIRKQTMANAERFFTRELKEREDEVLGAESRRIDLEKDLFTQLKESILPFASSLRSIGNRLSLLDLTVSLAECSCRKGWVKPRITDSNTLNIKNGYHPVIASSMGSEFVPNSLVMTPDDGIISVLTGPNMGGKSTFLRQNALIVILAQMGSYVPAESAEIGIVDKIFTRIGASDNLLEGESTFMVEMKEVAHILAKATPRSFLLIDELGRGTATEDGLAIAQSVIEWIAEHLSCRTLFATHFHDLTELETSYPFVSNLSVGCLDRDGQIIFTHKVNKTPADRSYGVEVAKLAGLPQEIISRAEELIASYCELKRPHGIVQNNSRQLSFFRSDFQAPRIPADYTELKLLKEKIQKVDPMNMTPLEAISFLAKLRDNLL